MFNNEKSVAYILFSDPENLPSFASPRSSHLPTLERRILVGDDLRAQIVVDTEKLNMYLEDQAESDPHPFDRIWTFVRHGEEEPLREFPFLLTAGRLKHLVAAGKITLEPVEGDLSRNKRGKWLAARESRKPSADAVSLAHTFGPVFSLARSIFEDKDIPAAGQKWEVKVHLLEADDDAGTNQVWHEYTCEVVLSDALIAQAKEAARRYSEAPPPFGWVTKWRNVSLFVGSDTEEEKGFRTDEADMEELRLSLREIYDFLSESAVGAGILQYLVGWDAHIPKELPKDFYHGLCHGFRVSRDSSRILIQIHSESREARLLEQLFEYLAAKAAEAFLDEPIEARCASMFGGLRPLPRYVLDRCVLPFRIETRDIEKLSLDVDQELIAKVGPLFSKTTTTPGEPPRAPVLEPDYGAVFYEGVVHAMTLSEHIMAIYEENILPAEITDVLNLEQGSHRVCCIAARHWVQAIHGEQRRLIPGEKRSQWNE
jgi:hypothetical protein